MNLKITIFTVPKAFLGDIAVLQEKAIESWMQLSCKPNIVLFGDDDGVKEVCKKFKLTHYPKINKNDLGTYFLDDVFSNIENISQDDILFYVNADIIFTEKIIEAIEKTLENKKIIKDNFLIIGSRWDFDAPNDYVFSTDFAHNNGEIHPPWGSDFFVYPNKKSLDMPPFLIGRPYWDNWFIYHFLKKKVPVIDVTDYTLAYHQNHDYSHVKNRTGYKWDGPESNYTKNLFMQITNYRENKCVNLKNASYKLNKNGVLNKSFFNNLSAFFNFRKIFRLVIITPIFSVFLFLLVLNLNNFEIFIIYLPIQYILLVQTYIYVKLNKKIEKEGFLNRKEIRNKILN